MKTIPNLVFGTLLALALAACAPAGSAPGPAAVEPTAAVTEATATLESAMAGEATVAVASTAIAAGAGPVELSAAALGNATYRGILDQTVTLADGRFEGEAAEPGATARPVITLLPEPMVTGDLDGDSRPDSAVLLVAESGGSGTFVYMAVVGLEDGRPVNLATTQLGDRVQVKELAIEDGQIAVTLVTHGPTDPMCCPTQEETRLYRVEDGELIQTSNGG